MGDFLKGLFSFENNTRKMAWVLMLGGMVMWFFWGFAFLTAKPATDGRPVIADVGLMAAFFGLLTAVMLPILLSAVKSNADKKLNGNGTNGDGGGTTPPCPPPEQ
jgi:hypothetical protein